MLEDATKQIFWYLPRSWQTKVTEKELEGHVVIVLGPNWAYYVFYFSTRFCFPAWFRLIITKFPNVDLTHVSWRCKLRSSDERSFVLESGSSSFVALSSNESPSRPLLILQTQNWSHVIVIHSEFSDMQKAWQSRTQRQDQSGWRRILSVEWGFWSVKINVPQAQVSSSY